MSVVQVAGECYLWDSAEWPFRIRLSLDFVERLRAAVVQEFGGSERRETGGLLVGRRVASPTGRRTVEIIDFEPVPFNNGTLYIASEADKTLLAERCAAVSSGEAGRVAVGFYRSRFGGPVRLDHSDSELAYWLFATPDCVFLAMTQSGPGTVIGGIFGWDPSGTLQTDSSALEFPLDANALREMQARQTTEGPLRTAPAQRQRSRPAVPAPAEAPAEEGSARVEPPRQAWLAKRGSALSSRKYLLVAASVLFCIVVGILAALGSRQKSNVSSNGDAPVGSQQKSNASNNGDVLHVEQDGPDVRLTWSKSLWFGGASRAVLTVNDGLYSRDFAVDPRLESGMLLYTPITNNPEFRIRVVVSNVERSQSIRVTANNPSGTPSSASPQTPVQNMQPQIGETKPLASIAEAKPQSRSPVIIRPAHRRHTPEDSTQSSAPSVAPAGQTKPLTLPAIGTADRPSSPSPPEVRRPPTAPFWSKPQMGPVVSLPRPGAEPADPVTADYIPPRPITRIVPQILPAVRATMPSDGSVDVTLAINENGGVTSAAVTAADGISERSPAAKLAEDAARSWKFEPAVLRGHNVASQMVVHFILRAE